MGLVMRDHGRDMRDRGEGPRPLRCQTQKSVHLLVTHLSCGKQLDARFGVKSLTSRTPAPVDNILVYGEFRKKGNPQVLSQQADDEFRVANLQKGVYLLALGRQILVQDETTVGVCLVR